MTHGPIVLAELSKNLDQAIESWRAKSNDLAFSLLISLFCNSLRNADAIRASGQYSVNGSTVTSQKRAIHGVNYAVESLWLWSAKISVKLQARKLDLDRYELLDLPESRNSRLSNLRI